MIDTAKVDKKNKISKKSLIILINITDNFDFITKKYYLCTVYVDCQ